MWQLYALIQAVIILFVGMVFSQMAIVESGKTFSFWAGGHIVYFECVLVVNIVLLRGTHNWTGWGEAVVLLQLISFFTCVYLDSIMLTQGQIAYFFDEYMSSWTAWLGVLLVGSLLLIEKAVLDAWRMRDGTGRIGIVDSCSESEGKTVELNELNERSFQGQNRREGNSEMNRYSHL